MIVGNKCDCVERDVAESEGLRLAKQWSCSFIETSAKQEFHTRELFEQLLLLEKRQSMSLTEAQTHKKSGPSKSSKRAENIKNKCTCLSAMAAMPKRVKKVGEMRIADRKSTRLNSSHTVISYAVFCLKKKKN